MVPALFSRRKGSFKNGGNGDVSSFNMYGG